MAKAKRTKATTGNAAWFDRLVAKDLAVIDRIAERAAGLCLSHNMIAADAAASCKAAIAAELKAVHMRIKLLMVDDLLAASDDDLMNDVVGIHRRLRVGADGQPVLADGWLPKFAFVRPEGCLPRMPPRDEAPIL
jgi:hypothetical protein